MNIEFHEIDIENAVEYYIKHKLGLNISEKPEFFIDNETGIVTAEIKEEELED